MSDLRSRGSRHVWNPMSRMSDVVDRQRVWVRGEGSTLYDETGRGYIDAIASLWYQHVGYGRTEIAEAVDRQLRTLPTWMLFGANLNPPAVELAERLAALTPGDLDRMYFTCGGSESVETAIKIARGYHRLLGQPGRYKLIARHGTYHGSTLGALSATGTRHNRTLFEPLVPGFRHVEPFSLSALEEMIAFEGPDTVAAVLVEPSLAASGLRFPPDDYLPAVRALCDEHGILLIGDEVICGFGRTGTWFGVDHWQVVPDLITMAKGMSSGYLPIGGVAVSGQVVEPFASSESPDRSFNSGNTYAGHAACCAAALENLDIIEREGLIDRSARLGTWLLETCRRLDASGLVSEVTGGRGLAIGVHLRRPVAAEVAAVAFELGVIVRPLTPTIVTLSPPLVITTSELDVVVAALEEALAALASRPASVIGQERVDGV